MFCSFLIRFEVFQKISVYAENMEQSKWFFGSEIIFECTLCSCTICTKSIATFEILGRWKNITLYSVPWHRCYFRVVKVVPILKSICGIKWNWSFICIDPFHSISYCDIKSSSGNSEFRSTYWGDGTDRGEWANTLIRVSGSN